MQCLLQAAGKQRVEVLLLGKERGGGGLGGQHSVGKGGCTQLRLLLLRQLGVCLHESLEVLDRLHLQLKRGVLSINTIVYEN